MKRKVLGFAAIAIAIAASAFTVPTSTKAGKFANLKWFSISGSLATSAAVPRANATYLGQFASAPTQSGCSTTASKQCVSGFDESKVDPSTNQLIDDMQTANDPHYKRN
jgi:hypothetical protein